MPEPEPKDDVRADDDQAKDASAEAAEAEGEADVTAESDAEAQPMADLAPEVKAMADSCFVRAQDASGRSNFDYAIALYLEGLRYNLRDLEAGHRGLRDTALRRRNEGKGAGLAPMMGQVKAAFYQMLGRHKDALLALEAAIAHDPGNTVLLGQAMQSARRLHLDEIAIWFGELAAEETLRSKKPQKQIFLTLADLYEEHEHFQKAVDSLAQALKIDPNDRELDRRARNLSAAASIQKGKLEEVESFHDMIRDTAQASKSATQKVVRTREQLDAQYTELKAALDEDPDNPVKIQALADCQARRGFVDEAMELLEKAKEISQDYRYKARQDDIRMAGFRARLRAVDAKLESNPDQADLVAERKKVAEERDQFEFSVYQERTEQYPTDMNIRFELGIRQYRLGRLDDAIVSFQQSSRDPKRRVESLNMLGKCFFSKKLYREAQGQFENAIQVYDLTNDPMAKELRYNLAMTFETLGKAPEAIEWYSAIVQQDYQYRDAAKRLEALRQQVEE